MDRKSKREKLREQLTHLSAGELGWWQSYQLRRELARDPEMAREYDEIRQLWSDLKLLQTAEPSRRPVWPEPFRQPSPTFTLGGLTMKRRTALIACALLSLTVTGAIAGRELLGFAPTYSFSDKQGHLWVLKTKRSGKVQVFDINGNLVGSARNSGHGSEAEPVEVTYAQKVKVIVQGPGRHEIRDPQGYVMGFVELSSLTETDKAEIEEDTAFRWKRTEAVFKDKDVVTASNERWATSDVTGYPGLALGVSRETGVSWKVFGQHVRVVATSTRDNKEDRQEGATVILTPATTPEGQAVTEKFEALAPPPTDEPVIYWSLADKVYPGEYKTPAEIEETYGTPVIPKEGLYLLTHEGKWAKVQQSGTVKGYGLHEIKDENGKVVLTLDVSETVSARQ